MKSKSQLIVGISGSVLTAEEHAVLTQSHIHGVILFARNYQTPTQLKKLTTEIHALRPQHPLKIYVDQEGGRVQRFRKGFTLLPSLGQLKQSETFAWAELMAIELKLYGIDHSFAPVIDLDRGSVVIGDRAFSSDVDQVIWRAEAYIEGMEKAGMSGIVKHFPGHGSVTPDTHVGRAEDLRSLAELEATDLKPFCHFAQRDVGIMVSHVVYPQIDSEPASLSSFWMRDYLRGRLQFKGPIFTDDLGMKAVSDSANASDLVLRAFAAGADYALLCNDWAAVIDTLAVLR